MGMNVTSTQPSQLLFVIILVVFLYTSDLGTLFFTFFVVYVFLLVPLILIIILIT